MDQPSLSRRFAAIRQRLDALEGQAMALPAQDGRFLVEALERLSEDIEACRAAAEQLAAQNRALTDDIGECKRIETEREPAESTTVTDLAHEINQPLTAIMSYAQAGRTLLRMNPGSVDEIAEALEKIFEQGGRASEMVQRVREES